MAYRKHRNDAFSVSFPEEVEKLKTEEAERAANPQKRLHSKPTVSVPVSSVTPTPKATPVSVIGALKRPLEDEDDSSASRKKLQLPREARFVQPDSHKRPVESNRLILPGEVPPEDDEDDNTVPTRYLDDFSIFDPKDQNKMISLSLLDTAGGKVKNFEGEGCATVFVERDEDEGQDVDDTDDWPTRIRLTAILRYYVDYSDADSLIWIQTSFAWYMLKLPSKQYTPFFHHFYLPQRITQLIVSSAMQDKDMTYERFVSTILPRLDSYGQSFGESDIALAVPLFSEVIPEDYRGILDVPLIKKLLGRSVEGRKSTTNRRPLSHKGMDIPSVMKRSAKKPTGIGLDDWVLRRENRVRTTVTPLIDNLTRGLVREELRVIGPPPKEVDKDQVKREQAQTLARLSVLLERAQRKKKVLWYDHSNKVVGTDYITTIKLDGEQFKVGDVVLFANGNKELWSNSGLSKSPPIFPEDARLDDYFWFARVMWFRMDDQKVHFQWFDHGSTTVIEELALPNRLFLTDSCGTMDLQKIIGKVVVHERPSAPLKHGEFFYDMVFNKDDSSFTGLDDERLELCRLSDPPNNCPVCVVTTMREEQAVPRILKQQNNVVNGVAIDGTNFHLNDFVLYRADSGPAHIGYITALRRSDPVKVKLRKVGRVTDLPREALPRNERHFRDQRELFLTDEVVDVDVESLIKVIYVILDVCIQDEGHKFKGWCDESIDHFYIKHSFPTLTSGSSEGRRTFEEYRDLHLCMQCYKAELDRCERVKQFQRNCEHLATLDLFGGVGGLSRQLAEESKCIKVTHAIEISPSACKTFERNSPHTIVYNQCVNTMLRYFIKHDEGHVVDVPRSLGDDEPVGPPPPKGSIKVITAGFPCQAFSPLNMFKRADDTKSNLMLTMLSYFDYYKPDYGFMENVLGFLNHSLCAKQAGRHRVEGGIDKGGLKILVESFIQMGYQVRYGVLQAAHYGAPQRRERFFMVVAKQGKKLPAMPMPTHDFEHRNLVIKQNPVPFSAVPKTSGRAMYKTVSIDDAIGDLLRFDWQLRDQRPRPRRLVDGYEIPLVICDPKKPWAGFAGRQEYQMPPKNSYQQAARKKRTLDLQHYTMTFNPKTIKRVIHVPLKANADYRDLPSSMFQWQIADPSSAVGRTGFKPGLYGRPGKNDVFQTTVTNLKPDAKQSKVLHPECQRVFSVRELARSQGFPDDFVFYAPGDHVVTMHRQIGNAVPLQIAGALGRMLGQAVFERWTDEMEVD